MSTKSQQNTNAPTSPVWPRGRLETHAHISRLTSAILRAERDSILLHLSLFECITPCRPNQSSIYCLHYTGRVNAPWHRGRRQREAFSPAALGRLCMLAYCMWFTVYALPYRVLVCVEIDACGARMPPIQSKCSTICSC